MIKRNNAIEFYRFLFSQIIILFHMVSNAEFSPKPFVSGNLAVEFFFILSGFFLAENALRKDNVKLENAINDNLVYTRNRFIRLYPHYLLSIFLYAIVRMFVFKNLKLERWLYSGISEILMLQSVDQINYLSSVFWFPSALLVSSFVVSFLMRWKPYLCTRFIFPLAAMGILSVLMNTNGRIYNTRTYHYVFSDALWRAMADVMIGCICYDIVRSRAKNEESCKHPVLFCFVEICILITVILLMFYPQFKQKGYLVIILFSLLIIFVLSQESMLSRILNTRISAYLGKISYAIYLNHIIIHNLINRYYPYTNIKEFCSAAVLCIVINTIFSMMTTYIVEKIHRIIRFGKAN